MRGKVPSGYNGECVERITPAYAGKSLCQYSGTLDLWDHPRLCGEKRMCPLMSCVAPGSPPPMRGKADLLNSTEDRLRITPAYAGKSK